MLTKEVLEDKNATTLKEIGAQTAGVTLGTGEGGNAFGDRFFIRGFDARNDVFVDGIRDPGVSIRENFFTEQIEILRGPGIVLSPAAAPPAARSTSSPSRRRRRTSTTLETEFATDSTKRVTFDVNQVINPTLSVRTGGMWQDADVAGRDLRDRRSLGRLRCGRSGPRPTTSRSRRTTSTPICSGLPDFGVPYQQQGNAR